MAPHPNESTAGALDALVAVTSSPDIAGRPEETLGGLVRAMAGAVGADAAAIWAGEAQEGSGHTVVVTPGSAVEADGLSQVLAAAPVVPDEMVVAPGSGDGVAAEAVAALGGTHGRVLPVMTGEVQGAVCVLAGAAALDDDPLRLHAVRVGATRAGHVLEEVRLRDNLERAMAQILLTDERMLGRMGLDIHDGPTQQLSVALLEVQLLEAELADAQEAGLPAPETLRPALGRIYETVGGALHEMRELIGHLRPAQFEDRRLNEILQDAITGFELRTDCRVEAEWEGDFPVNGVSITQRITLYRILQETLTNAQRHGHAESVRVRVAEDETGVALEVCDDGVGFHPHQLQRRRPGMPLARFGVHGMRDRAQILGGSFDISSEPGAGTTVKVFLPRWAGAAADVPSDVA